jgi:protein-disulfide isomerase
MNTNLKVLSLVTSLLALGSCMISEALAEQWKGNTYGRADAPVTIEIYHDLNCGMCNYWYQKVFPQLDTEYFSTGRAKLVVREFPMIQNEKNMQLAVALKCAAEQDRYFDFLKGHFSYEGETDVHALAQHLHLDPKKFDTCLKDPSKVAEIESDIQAGKALNVPGTPSFGVNGTPVYGAYSIDKIRKIVDSVGSK